MPGGHFGYLQTELLQQTVLHGYRNDWRRALPNPSYLTSLLASFLAAGVIGAATAGLFRFLEPQEFHLGAVLGLDRHTQEVLPTTLAAVEPGDTSVERGTSLLVLARFTGQLPLKCTLHCTDANGDEGQIEMSQSLQDPVFAGRVALVEQDFRYRVHFGTQMSPEYHVQVFEYPTLVTADAILEFPAYTSLGSKTVQDVRHITAVEGTTLTLLCHLNKEVARAELQGDESVSIDLTPDASDPTTYRATFPLVQSQRLHLHLEDAEGRRNKEPPEFVITVTPNRPPNLTVTFPSHDVEVSPIEELRLAAQVWDDFGLSRVGVTYQLADAAPQEITVGTNLATGEKATVEHLLKLEDLHAEPNQLISYYFWAEDLDAEGQTRRLMSDMFFAEVRPFDEIYRQGQQPPGGDANQQRQQQQSGQGQQNPGNQLEQLVEQQKEIINATWNILRRENDSQVSEGFQEDVAVVRDAQVTLGDNLSQLAQQIRDGEAQEHISTFTAQTQQAVAELTRATDEKEVAPMRTAIQAEQAAYQTLLQLRAREHEVIRSNQQNAQQARNSQGSNNRSQQQLQQLALSNEQNRYETQREAASQQENPAETEQRQILNRLRDLAPPERLESAAPDTTGRTGTSHRQRTARRVAQAAETITRTAARDPARHR